MIKTDQALFVCLLNHSDMISEIKVHGILLLFHFVSVLSITNHEKQEKIEYTTKYQNEQFSQLTNSKNLVKYDAVTPARTNQSALAEITKIREGACTGFLKATVTFELVEYHLHKQHNRNLFHFVEIIIVEF